MLSNKAGGSAAALSPGTRSFGLPCVDARVLTWLRVYMFRKMRYPGQQRMYLPLLRAPRPKTGASAGTWCGLRGIAGAESGQGWAREYFLVQHFLVQEPNPGLVSLPPLKRGESVRLQEPQVSRVPVRLP